MRFAYADPPYPGCIGLYADQPLHSEVNHPLLIAHLMDEFADGWLLSTASTTLRYVLELCPAEVRVCAWVKPFASFKPNVNPGYVWEPVILYGGRRYTRDDQTVRDWIACNITLKRGFVGAKPEKVCRWMLQLLNVQPGDEVADLFPGTGVMGRVIDSYLGEPRYDAATLFGGAA